MQAVVNLKHIPYFGNAKNLKKLNRHIRLHSDLMQHQIAGATGCSKHDAEKVLLTLSLYDLGSFQLLIYHQDNLSVPFQAKSLFGEQSETTNPSLSTDLQIETVGELSYDIMLTLLSNDIKFVS